MVHSSMSCIVETCVTWVSEGDIIALQDRGGEFPWIRELEIHRLLRLHLNATHK